MPLVVIRDPGVVTLPGRARIPARRPLRVRVPVPPVLRSPAAVPAPVPRYAVRAPVPAALMPQAPTQQAVAVAGPALAVGIVAAGGTSLSMIAANLLVGPRTDISNFRILALDAGSW
jgi:hypothetical protein